MAQAHTNDPDEPLPDDLADETLAQQKIDPDEVDPEDREALADDLQGSIDQDDSADETERSAM